MAEISQQLYRSPQSGFSQGNVRFDADNASDDDYSSSEISDSSNDEEPGWQEEAMKSGELFYVAENEDEAKHAEINKAEVENNLIYEAAKPKVDSKFEKTVFVNVQSATAYSQNSNTTLLASMLGIIVLDHNSNREDLISIDALVPGSIALRCGQIGVGDILFSVNDVEVTKQNIEAFLKKIRKPACLKLTLHAFGKPLANQDLDPIVLQLESNAVNYQCVATLLTPHISRQNRVYSLTENHCVFYLTLKINSDTAAEFDDLLYSFPSVEAAIAPSKLAQVRGLFLTLSDLTRQSFHTKALSTTLRVGDETVHCAHYQNKTEVLIICFPAAFYSLAQVHIAVANAVRLLSIMYGDLENAFQPENKERLDHMFHYFLYLNASTGSTPLKGNYSHKIPGVLQLSLSPDLQDQVNSALAELEASDFDDGSSSLSYSRRLYTVRGSCLFYDGSLLASHLPKDDLKDVHLFCHNHNLLTIRRKERIGLLVIWRELFRWYNKTLNPENVFPESTGRYFLLVVGLKRSLLCCVLQLNGKLFPSTHTPRPDIKFVDSVKAILINLEAGRFFASVASQLNQPSLPKLVCSENFLPHSKSVFGSTSKPPLSDTPQKERFKLRIGSPLKFKSETDDGKAVTPKKSSEKMKQSSRASRSLFRDRTPQEANEKLKSPRTSKENRPNVSNVENQLDSLQLCDNENVVNITSGPGNSLFCFMKLDTRRGILIMPPEFELSNVGGEVHHDIITNFRKYSLVLHQRLALKDESSDQCLEEGILFQYRPLTEKDEPKKSSKYLQYWVIGRRMNRPIPHEFYVCFHNSAPQSAVEMAFKSSVHI